MPKGLSYTDFKSATTGDEENHASLAGHLLIAMPSMFDPNFEQTVIYICAHSEHGAVGLVVNRPTGSVFLKDLLEQLEIPSLHIPKEKQVLIGGPVETERGFVLHSTDYCREDATLKTSDTIGLTATLDILSAIATGEVPKRSLLAIGYSGWGPGQLEEEIQANGWLHCPASDALIFDEDYDSKWQRAIGLLGIDVSQLSSDAGHA
ncbi:MAG: YqgE/AlgH family protein [Alphaproteobacteria bacterium]|nr:MAG: YqgE/AlgH family protein [Alphaproteobacteria bacterium]